MFACYCFICSILVVGLNNLSPFSESSLLVIAVTYCYDLGVLIAFSMSPGMYSCTCIKCQVEFIGCAIIPIQI